MITKQDLLSTGYKFFNQQVSFRSTSLLYQKRIWREGVGGYYINFWWYERFKMYPDSWEAEVQFGGDGERTFNVSTHCWRDATVADVEDFFKKAHEALVEVAA